MPLFDNGQIAHQSRLRYVGGHGKWTAHAPEYNGYVGIVMPEPGRNTRLQAVNGKCLGCGYRLAWIVIRGRRLAPQRSRAAIKALCE